MNFIGQTRSFYVERCHLHAVVDLLAKHSAAGHITPWPDDQWHIEVKDDGHTLVTELEKLEPLGREPTMPKYFKITIGAENVYVAAASEAVLVEAVTGCGLIPSREVRQLEVLGRHTFRLPSDREMLRLRLIELNLGVPTRVEQRAEN